MASSVRIVDPNKIHVGDIILVATGSWITERVQKQLGFGASSRWTHVAGSLGGYDLIEGQIPRARVAHLQNDYVSKHVEIKVMRRQWENDQDRIKVALWWATMNNLRYDFFELAWFGIACLVGKELLLFRNKFNNRGREICSELIADGFYKQGYNLFDRPASDVLPANFDEPALFQEITDVWQVEETVPGTRRIMS